MTLSEHHNVKVKEFFWCGVAQNARETCNPHPGENQVCVTELESVTLLSQSVRILFQIIMARRWVSDNLQWQIIGMRNAG